MIRYDHVYCRFHPSTSSFVREILIAGETPFRFWSAFMLSEQKCHGLHRDPLFVIHSLFIRYSFIHEPSFIYLLIHLIIIHEPSFIHSFIHYLWAFIHSLALVLLLEDSAASENCCGENLTVQKFIGDVAIFLEQVLVATWDERPLIAKCCSDERALICHTRIIAKNL